MTFIEAYDALVDTDGLSVAELGLLLYFFRHQGEDFVFKQHIILKKFDICKPTYLKLKNSLIDKGLICSNFIYEAGKIVGCRIRVNANNFSVDKNTVGRNTVGRNTVGRNFAYMKEVNKEGSKLIKEVNHDEGGGTVVPLASAAEFSAKSEDNIIDISKAKAQKAHSGEKKESIPEHDLTGQISLFPEEKKDLSIPIPEKRERKKTAFIPPTRDQITDQVKKTLSDKNISSWTDANIEYFVDRFINYYAGHEWHQSNGKPLIYWKIAVGNWLSDQQYMPHHPRNVPIVSQDNNLPSVPGMQNQQRPVYSNPQNQKTFKERDNERINKVFTDPEQHMIEGAVGYCVLTGTTFQIDNLPEHLRERASTLLKQKYAERGDKPVLIPNLNF